MCVCEWESVVWKLVHRIAYFSFQNSLTKVPSKLFQIFCISMKWLEESSCRWILRSNFSLTCFRAEKVNILLLKVFEWRISQCTLIGRIPCVRYNWKMRPTQYTNPYSNYIVDAEFKFAFIEKRNNSRHEHWSSPYNY